MKSQLGKRKVLKESEEVKALENYVDGKFKTTETEYAFPTDFVINDDELDFKALVAFMIKPETEDDDFSVGTIRVNKSNGLDIYFDNGGDVIGGENISPELAKKIIDKVKSQDEVQEVYMTQDSFEIYDGGDVIQDSICSNKLFNDAFGDLPILNYEGGKPFDKYYAIRTINDSGYKPKLNESKKQKNKTGLSESFIKSASRFI